MAREKKSLPSADEIEAVERLGGLQFTRDEVEVVIERKLCPELETAYRRGYLKGEADVRAGVKRMAIQGSTPAQKAYLDLVSRRRSKENRRARAATKKK